MLHLILKVVVALLFLLFDGALGFNSASNEFLATKFMWRSSKHSFDGILRDVGSGREGRGDLQNAIHCGRPSLLFNSKESSSSKNADDSPGTKKDMDLLTKSSWYGVELFGKVFGKGSGENDGSSASTSAPPKSLGETIQRIEMDNDQSYFLNGKMDVEIYDKDCVFADPFVSFSGRDRFKENLANLGSFITAYDARVLKYSTVFYRGPMPVIETKIMVKLQLNLPWKPILAWPWGVTYEIDPETFLVTKHQESWDVEPLEGVKQIFRKPTLKL